MVSKKLMGVWAGLDIALLASGILVLVLSMVWRAPNVLMNLVLSPADLTAGTVLGVSLIVTFVISIAAIVQRNHVTIGLVLLNYCLLVDSLMIVVIGTFVWWFTLQERANFHVVWQQASDAVRIDLQDKFKCCGYFGANDTLTIGGQFCVSQDFVNSLKADDLNNFCVTPVTNFADSTLNNVFTTIYGFMAVVLCLLLATLCVIKKRKEAERFKKIDAKRGGRGFV